MKRQIIGLFLLMLLSSCASQTEARKVVVLPIKPNIIFIIADDQNTDQIGYIGGKVLTPHIDRMAESGIRFNRCYASASVCSPSRYTCLSGQYASRCSIPQFTKAMTIEGVTRVLWNIGFSEDQITLPVALQQSGYKTGFVGKWHINGLPGWKPLPDGSDPTDPEVIAHLKRNLTNAENGIKKFGFNYAKHVFRGNPWDDKALRNSGLNVHNQEWLTQAGLEFIEQNKNNPFFLYFATTLTHVPDNYASLVGDARKSPVGILPEPIKGVQPSRESVIERCKTAGIDKELWGATWLDDGVGALTKKLDELGLSENTLVIYFVDHGMAAASKGTCYEGGLIAPTFAYWPGVVQSQVSQAMIQNIDFAPTIMEVAGVTPPDDMVIDGKSFAPLLRGDKFRGHDSVYSEIGLTRAVTTADGWKYIAFKVPPSLQRTKKERMADQMKLIEQQKEYGGYNLSIDPEAPYYQMGMGAGGTAFERHQLNGGAAWKDNYFHPDQLYNLNKDPLETKNLAKDPAYTNKLAEMKKLLVAYLNDLPGTYPELKPAP